MNYALHFQYTYQFLMTLGYPFVSICVTKSDHITSPGTVTAHAPCHVTYHRGGAKMIHIFEIPDLNLPFHFVTFRELRRRL